MADGGIIPGQFNPTTDDWHDDESRKRTEVLQKAINGVSINIKPTADIEHTWLEAGKLETERLFLRKLTSTKNTIVVRDLNTFESIEKINIDRGYIVDEENISTLTFYGALQLAINAACDEDQELGNSNFAAWRKHYLLLNEQQSIGGELGTITAIDPKIFDSEITQIKEALKDRSLTKTSAFLIWVLTVASQLIQTVLAEIPSHTVGLKGASDAWNFFKRINTDDPFSDFLFDSKTGEVIENAVFFSTDWRSATDGINRFRGSIIMKAFMDYTSFPGAYGRLTLWLMSHNLKTKERYSFWTRYDQDEQGIMRLLKGEWNGEVKRGFPMGVITTKAQLHLMHVPEVAAARLATSTPNSKARIKDFKTKIRLDRLNPKRFNVKNPAVSKGGTYPVLARPVKMRS